MLALRGGRILHPSHGIDRVGDLYVGSGGVVFEHAGTIDREIDVSGCWVVPGLVDLRTHLREPGEEHEENIASGREAAAAGGFTAICAMPGTHPVNDTRAVTELIRARAAGPGPRVWPFAAITKGMRGQELTEMAELAELGVVGVTDDRHAVTDAGLLRRAMEYARTFDLVVAQHCEEPALAKGWQMHEGPTSTRLGLPGSPREAEDAAVARDLHIAELTGARYHVAHISSAGAVALIRAAKARGTRVTCDVSPHHLTFSDADVVGYDTQMKVIPPLREASDREALRGGIEDGTIDAIATDHAPHASLEKRCEFDAAAPGMIGLELALPMVLALVERGVLTAARAIAALALGPATVIGKDEGFARGDITIIDPDVSWTVERSTLRSKSLNTPLLGQTVRGGARATIVAGDLVFERKGAA